MGFEIVPFQGKRIAVVDLSRTRPAEAMAVMEVARERIARFPPGTGLVLTDATEAAYDQASTEALKAFAVANGPYVKAAAVVGAEGLRGVLLRLVVTLTRRNIKPFRDRAEAMDWLAKQA